MTTIRRRLRAGGAGGPPSPASLTGRLCRSHASTLTRAVYFCRCLPRVRGRLSSPSTSGLINGDERQDAASGALIDTPCWFRPT